MTGEETRHLFCFGLGYSARALAENLVAEGWKISGTTRSAAKAAELEAAGFIPYIFDGTAPLKNAAAVLKDITHILISIPPGADGDAALEWHGHDIASAPRLQWLGYLSTTGVYGDKGGDWVSEETPPAPTSPRGQWRLQAEEGWLNLWRECKTPVQLFRLAGIYGPGQNQLEAIISGTARRIIKPGQVFSRIHRDDIVGVLKASITRPNPGAVYNLCDDEAAPPQEVISYAAALLGRAAPPAVPFDEAELSPMAASFYAENKRVRNDRIKQELGVKLAYPTYREGLKTLFEQMVNGQS
jgi:nucleoside-diphosphate-sugar epimerase